MHVIFLQQFWNALLTFPAKHDWLSPIPQKKPEASNLITSEKQTYRKPAETETGKLDFPEKIFKKIKLIRSFSFFFSLIYINVH